MEPTLVLQLSEWMERRLFHFSFVDRMSRLLQFNKFDGTIVRCATVNVNANIRGLSRTFARGRGRWSAFGYQRRQGNFFVIANRENPASLWILRRIIPL